MRNKLDLLSAGIDRTAEMGLFPYDSPQDLEQTRSADLLAAAEDQSKPLLARDQAIWNLVYREQDRRIPELPELLLELARSDRIPAIRRSAAWALFKIGDKNLLAQCPAKDDDDNVGSWKQHLIYESQGRLDYIDPRPIRLVESELGYGATLPLMIHGIVQFRIYDYRHEASSPSSPSPATTQYSGAGDGEAVKRLDFYGSENYNWYSMVVGPQAQRNLVGYLTAAVSSETFYDRLTIQKHCPASGSALRPTAQGASSPREFRTSTPLPDHIQGYIFSGMSRNLSAITMAHYYHSNTPQPYYLSGRIGDESEGVLNNVATSLSRAAETNLAVKANIPFPYVQSVRGLFYGPSMMNTIVVYVPNVSLNRLLQIVAPPHSNGWFFGEFRSIPVDVDGDGTVELNGIEMFVDTVGNVTNRTPPTSAMFSSPSTLTF